MFLHIFYMYEIRLVLCVGGFKWTVLHIYRDLTETGRQKTGSYS